jgi:hypothetical protein
VHSGLGIFKMATVHMETVNVCGQVHGEKKKRKNNNNKKQCKNNNSPNVVWGHITRFDCVWMQTQKSPSDPSYRKFGHVDASFINTNQFLTSKYS